MAKAPAKKAPAKAPAKRGRPSKAKPVEPRIVEAIGVATSTGSNSAAVIESAMKGAAEEAQAKGITDPNEIREMVLAARDRARKGL